MSEIGKTSEYLFELLRCALNGTVPSDKPAELTWHEVYALASRHSVSALAFYAVKQTSQQIDPQLMQKWFEQYSKMLVKGTNQAHELTRICESFSAAKIMHMPLKGSCLRELLAQPELREMSDLDILVPREMIDAATDVMVSLGYTVEEDNGNHISFKKRPYLFVEIHRDLISPKYEFFSVFEQPWDYAKQTKVPYRYELSLEDFYIYTLAHAAKHYYYQGTGIRSVIDVYLLRKEYAERLDWSYIEKRITLKLLLEFKQQIEALADKWFASEAKQSCDTSEMAHYIINSSTYGSRSGYARRIVRQYMQKGKSERHAKRSYFFHMVFLPKSEMKVMYPVLDKAPILLPFCWVSRWFRILFRKPDSIAKRYRQAKNVDIYTKEEK